MALGRPAAERFRRGLWALSRFTRFVLVLALGIGLGITVLTPAAADSSWLVERAPSGPIVVDETSAPDITLSFQAEAGTEFSIKWYILKAGPVDPPGFDGTVTGVLPDADGRFSLPIDLTGLASGYYAVFTEITDTSGQFVGTVYDRENFEIDTEPPTIWNLYVDSHTVYPYKDWYYDTARITASTSERTADDEARFEFLDSHGVAVRTIITHPIDGHLSASWNGRGDGGVALPDGSYRLRLTVTDRVGRTVAADTMPTIKVINKRVVRDQKWTKVVSARASLEQARVGKCSSLVKNVRGWRGALGLHTASRCKGTFRRTLVVTTHAWRLPVAANYEEMRISMYGGANPAVRGSLLYFDQLVAKTNEWGDPDLQVAPELGWHLVAKRDVRSARAYVFDDRYIVWAVYTAKGAQYDVKAFRIKLKYDALVPAP